ncbi:MAG: DUF1592 domain-containing protein [Pirellulaceae bacterium]
MVPQRLTSYEMATNLAYFLWSSTPDTELLTTAFEQDLQNDDVLISVVEKMMRSERSNQLATNFASQWLQIRAIDRLVPDPDRFTGVDKDMLEDMRTETELFVQELIRTNASLLDLLDAPFTFVNRRLAKHYSLEPLPASNEQFVRVELSGTNRGGLLTQGSILTATSNPTRTSPVKRGKWILDNLLGEPPPPPLPDAMPLEQQQLTGTLREQMEQHRANPACASCHEVMDPLGFALENFDAVGRWRESDDGAEIDAGGVLPDGRKFAGAAELRQILIDSEKEKFIRCVTEKMLIYALGRGLRYEDQCEVNKIVEQLKANDYRFAVLIKAIVVSEPFRSRQRLVTQSN